MRNKKFIFVTGGVLSSLGKGLSAAAIGTLLEARNLRVINVKMDPYINVDPGTMSPYQHGEVFVTDDGAETDLDLGHYERFTTAPMSQRNNILICTRAHARAHTYTHTSTHAHTHTHTLPGKCLTCTLN